ncbi:MAG: MltA domain-containing protein, partial [Ahrensia sp.]
MRDDHAAALAALAQMNVRPPHYRYKTGALNIQPKHLMQAAALADTSAARSNPLSFFLEHFAFFDLVSQNPDSGLLTGFFEPLVEASAQRTSDFPIPLYAPPDDLVQVADADDTAQLPPGFRFARRREDGGLEPYFDRRAIEQGALDGRAQPIAFVRDRVVAFFIHIQGAACLIMPDGTRRRITYAAKSGHPFTGIGRMLIDRGAIAAADISMQSIKAWLYANPTHADALMWQNQSYIFFRQTDHLPDHPGPIAAAKVPLTPNRSIAVDRTVHTFG